jgi:hypothetical protein
MFFSLYCYELFIYLNGGYLGSIHDVNIMQESTIKLSKKSLNFFNIHLTILSTYWGTHLYGQKMFVM